MLQDFCAALKTGVDTLTFVGATLVYDWPAFREVMGEGHEGPRLLVLDHCVLEAKEMDYRLSKKGLGNSMLQVLCNTFARVRVLGPLRVTSPSGLGSPLVMTPDFLRKTAASFRLSTARGHGPHGELIAD